MDWIAHAVCLWVIVNTAAFAVLVAFAEKQSRRTDRRHFGL